MSTHSPLGPSSLERRKLCPGSYAMEKDLPEVTSDVSEDGTNLHLMVSAFLNGLMSEDTTLDQAGDDSDAVLACIEYARQLRTAFPHSQEYIEERLDLTCIHPLCDKGTADLVMVRPFASAHVVDWKFGYSWVPDARDNLQLAAYAIAAAEKHDLQSVTVHVVMPRKGVASKHTFTRDELRAGAEYIGQIIKRCLSPFAPLLPSPAACKYCKAQAMCPALASLAAELPVCEEPNRLPNSEVARLLKASKPVRAWIGALEQHAFGVLMAGGQIPGYMLGLGRSTRDWKDGTSEAQLESIGKSLGKDPAAVVVKELASPAQIEKSWGKAKKIKEALEPLIIQKPGNPRLEEVEHAAS